MKYKICLVCLLVLLIICQNFIFTFHQVFASDIKANGETNNMETDKNEDTSSDKTVNDLSINFKNFDNETNSPEVALNMDKSQEKIKQEYESKMENKEKIKQIKEKNETSTNAQLMGSTAQNEQAQNVTISFKDKHLFYAMIDEIEELLISYDEETYTIVISQDNLNSIEDLNLGSYGWESIGNGGFDWLTAYISDFSGIEKFVNLKELTIGIPNEVEYVDFTPIETLKNLERLVIGNNLNSDFYGIFNINHLAKVFPNLKTLYIYGIHNININHIEWPTTLEEIKIAECTFLEQPIVDWSELNHLKSLYIRQTNLCTIQDIKIPKNVEEIRFDSNELANLDNVDFGNCLSYIDLNDNQIEDISNVKFPNTLEKLLIGKNKLKSIDSLKDNTNLKLLSISDNYIEDIRVVENLTNLTGLYAGTWYAVLFPGVISGQIIDRENEIKNISNIKWPESLTFLDLSGNKITNIDNIHFPEKLNEIRLNKNEIAEINNFTILSNWRTINLENNDISKITGLKFEPTTKTRYLQLSYNQITNFVGVDWTNSLIEELDIAHNNLSTLENLPTDLEILVANNNKLSDISNVNWNALPIDSLDLACNQIEVVNNIEWNSHLRYLILSYNHISDISSLRFTSSLDALELAGNNISDLSVFSNEESNELIGLNLAKNNIRNITPLENVTDLKELLIGRNQIQDFSGLEKLQNLSSINAESQYYLYGENINAIPNILTEAMKESSIIATKDIEYDNCELKDGKINIIDSNQIATIIFTSGNAKGTTIYFDLSGKLQNNIYKISTKEDLLKISELSHKGVGFYGIEIQMEASIDMGAYYDIEEDTWKGDTWNPIGTKSVPFEGIFDGNFNTISGILTDENYAGIFGVSVGTIKRLGSKNSHIDGDISGGIVGYMYNLGEEERGIIQDCYNDSYVEGSSYAGGIVGKAEWIQICNTYNTGMIVGSDVAAGIVGSWTDSTYRYGNIVLYNVYNAGKILTKSEGETAGILGEFIGSTGYANLTNVYNVGYILNGNQMIYDKEIDAAFENCYVIPTEKNEEEFKDIEGIKEIDDNLLSQMLKDLNDHSENLDDWKLMDNYKYPVLKWQNEEQFDEQNKNLNIIAIRNPKENTNKDVILTIFSNKKMKQNDGWEISQDGYMQTKSFSTSESVEFVVEDIYGGSCKVDERIRINKEQIAIEDITIEYNKIADDYIIMKLKTKKHLKADLEGLIPLERWVPGDTCTTFYKIYYSQNLEDIITLEDSYGNLTDIHLPLSESVDMIPPQVKVEYSTKEITEGNVIVTVTITANEEVQELEGWTLSSDKKTLTKKYNTATEKTVVIKDIAGNETKVEIKVEIEEIYSEKYEIDNENRYILRVLPETTVNVFKTNISVKGTYKIVNSNGKEINGEEYITTGSKLITEDNKEYRISVIGDLNQSGTITLTDISMQRKHILELDILENEIYQAGDINKDGKITLDDLSKMRKIILGIEDMVS